jgi:hypothetical protein
MAAIPAEFAHRILPANPMAGKIAHRVVVARVAVGRVGVAIGVSTIGEVAGVRSFNILIRVPSRSQNH